MIMDYRNMSFGKGGRDRHLEDIRLVEGTLPFGYRFGAIGASAKLILDIEQDKPAWVNSFPFNAISITNEGGQEIKVYFNSDDGDNWVYLANNGTKDLILPICIRRIIIENLSDTTATTANKIVIEVYNTGRTADEKSKRQVF